MISLIESDIMAIEPVLDREKLPYFTRIVGLTGAIRFNNFSYPMTVKPARIY